MFDTNNCVKRKKTAFGGDPERRNTAELQAMKGRSGWRFRDQQVGRRSENGQRVET